MQRTLFRGVLVAAGLAAVPLGLWSQAAGATARDEIVDLLVLGADRPIDLKAYPPDVSAELQRYFRRYEAYRSKHAAPVKSGLDALVYAARVGHEERLAAVSGDPKAPSLAAAYVDRLRPCYEWEGFHDCPEREAIFAVDYQTANPAGPFSDYLPLLAAHRWLCAAEAYEYEKQPEGAAQSRRAYDETILTARQSKTPMIRLAAERLAERNSCLPQH